MPKPIDAVAGNIHVLEQGLDVLRRLEDSTYSGDPVPDLEHPVDGSPVGAHFRHILDHYHCFFVGLEQGRLDYDERERDPRLERERNFAIETIEGTLRQLAGFTAEEGELTLLVNVNSGGPDGETPDWSTSSAKRELQFLVSHTVHHFALIKEVLRRSGFDAGAEFGVAPSTLAHRRQQACAR